MKNKAFGIKLDTDKDMKKEKSVLAFVFFLIVCFYFVNFYYCTRKALCSYNSSSSSVRALFVFYV